MRMFWFVGFFFKLGRKMFEDSGLGKKTHKIFAETY